MPDLFIHDFNGQVDGADITVGPNADPSGDIILRSGSILTIDGGASLAAVEWFAEAAGQGATLRVITG